MKECEGCTLDDCGNCYKYLQAIKSTPQAGHWKKPDHIGFLLLLPFALLVLLNPLAIIPFSLCWTFTLIYDIMEQKSE